MPELPEVETTKRGISPWVSGRTITGVIARRANLRWPLPDLAHLLPQQQIQRVERRAKYLLLHCSNPGTLIIHLGMSGSLRILPITTTPQKHDHLDIQFGEQCLRLRDPRRFGAVLWTPSPTTHPLLANLGPEPLSSAFHADYLWERIRHRQAPIKNLLMDSKIVVGIGNIYATEALFLARIHPKRAGQKTTKSMLQDLVQSIKTILTQAIEQGGTTLRDFQQENGKPGYFRHQLQVYGRAGDPCTLCQTPLHTMQIGQRTSTYCTQCQH